VMMILRPQGIWPSSRRRLEMQHDDVSLTEDGSSTAQEAAK
jgi:hypothetical protein